jgi:hypothetical protein
MAIYREEISTMKSRPDLMRGCSDVKWSDVVFTLPINATKLGLFEGTRVDAI